MTIEISERADREMSALFGHRPRALTELAEAIPLAAQALADMFGSVLGEGGLGRAERELATLAALVTLGDTAPQLGVHAAAARRVGVSGHELGMLLHHLIPYVGFPKVLQALTALRPFIDDAPAERLVAVSDHRTRVIDRPAQGDARREPLVLVHALGLDRRMWSAVIDALPADRRIVAYDLRGHGSAADAAVVGNLHQLADDLAALLDGLGIDAAQVAGLSLGGAIAQTFALDHPGRLTRLDLIAAAADPNPAFEDRARAAENDGLPAQLAPTLTRWFTPSALAENPWYVRYARDLVVRNRLEQWAASWRALAGLETRPKLADITVPTRVIAGGRDLAYPPELMRTVADDIPGAQFHVIVEAPHMVSLETASQLAALLSE